MSVDVDRTRVADTIPRVAETIPVMAGPED